MDLLSIVIPTKNRDMFLKETLLNIYNGLNAKVEVVIVDGMSTDNTKLIVQEFLCMQTNLRYIEMQSAEGFDKELDIGVTSAKGKFCWVFSDDDIICGREINKIISFLEMNENLDLLLLNSSIWNKDLDQVISSKFLNHLDAMGSGVDQLFDKFIDYLSFFGGCIIRKDYWVKADPSRYYGSLFVHIGVIFSSKTVKWAWLTKPIVKIRYGNASWSLRSQEIWLKLWPELIFNLEHVPFENRIRKVSLTSFSLFKKLIFFKALNRFDKILIKKITLTENKKFHSSIIQLVDLFPRFVCVGISYSYARIYNKSLMLYDLKNSV